jgi:hypothetical protein
MSIKDQQAELVKLIRQPIEEYNELTEINFQVFIAIRNDATGDNTFEGEIHPLTISKLNVELMKKMMGEGIDDYLKDLGL